MKVLVTTCSFGGNTEREFVQQLRDLDITIRKYNDNNFPSRHKALHPRLKGKIPKMMAWLEEGYDYYIWMDSRFELSLPNSVQWIIDQCKDFDMALLPHPSRSSIKDEAEHVTSLMNTGNQYLIDRYEGEDIQGQVDKYLSDETFTDDKLFACGLFVYSKELVKNKEYNLLKEWFLHNCLYSVQDQISLPYLLHQFKINYRTITNNIFDCKSFRYL